MKPFTRNTLAAFAVAITLVTSAKAAEVIRPQIDEPLRDAAVTRAPDGTYYLTGTRAMNKRFVYDEVSFLGTEAF